MKYQYETSGTCSRRIDFEINADGTVGDVSFIGGCPGNLQGISSLVRGMKVEDVIARLDGIDCRGKGTSCSAEFVKALREVISKN